MSYWGFTHVGRVPVSESEITLTHQNEWTNEHDRRPSIFITRHLIMGVKTQWVSPPRTIQYCMFYKTYMSLFGEYIGKGVMGCHVTAGTLCPFILPGSGGGLLRSPEVPARRTPVPWGWYFTGGGVTAGVWGSESRHCSFLGASVFG